jgi:hypothetical protein
MQSYFPTMESAELSLSQCTGPLENRYPPELSQSDPSPANVTVNKQGDGSSVQLPGGHMWAAESSHTGCTGGRYGCLLAKGQVMYLQASSPGNCDHGIDPTAPPYSYSPPNIYVRNSIYM